MDCLSLCLVRAGEGDVLILTQKHWRGSYPERSHEPDLEHPFFQYSKLMNESRPAFDGIEESQNCLRSKLDRTEKPIGQLSIVNTLVCFFVSP